MSEAFYSNASPCRYSALVACAMSVQALQKEAIVLFVQYPKCSTCRKAKAWLDDRGIDYVDRHIVEDNPTADELRTWNEMSGLPLRRFFNTSGMLYRDMQLKDKLPDMSVDEQLDLPTSNGMLVKRPLVVLDDTVLVGFREKEWEAALL